MHLNFAATSTGATGTWAGAVVAEGAVGAWVAGWASGTTTEGAATGTGALAGWAKGFVLILKASGSFACFLQSTKYFDRFSAKLKWKRVYTLT